MTDKEQIIIDGIQFNEFGDFYVDYDLNGKFLSISSSAKEYKILKFLIEQLARKTQECENLKVEEKYLKQCCQKAGEELAKHSFDYDGKEKNLVVQAMELNEKYEKLEKALKEIELIIKNLEKDDILTFPDFTLQENATIIINQCNQGYRDILDIINKAKGEGNEE